MRTEYKVALLSLAFILSACSKRQEPTANLPDDLKKDLDAASASTSVLATAPQSYQRMRFVSDIEMSRATVKAPMPKISRHPTRMTASHHTSNVSDPVATIAEMAPAPVSTPAATETEQIVVAARPAPEPVSAPGPSQGTASDNHGGGLGGLLGGIFSGVVIRGGHAGPDKCDPRTDGRARGTITDRPDFGMPLPTGQPIFGGGRHR
jgi:hypothetical protein